MTPKPTAKKAAKPDRVEVRNPNVPTYRSTVEGHKYRAVKKALVKVLPREAPGLTQSEMMARVKGHLPEDLFPGGAKSEWWTKCVQLDLEARGEVAREASKPLRWHRP